jgi:hypothetical protein
MGVRRAGKRFVDEGAVVSVRGFGAVGDGVANDAAAIQSAIDTVPLGTEIRFPVGTYLISRPIDITKQVRLVGENRRQSIIKCSATGWAGSQILRNWTDADWTAGNDGRRPNTTASKQYYPAIEFLSLNTNGQTNVTCIAWVHFNESGFLRDLQMSSSATGTIGIALYANADSPVGRLDGAAIRDIVGYGSNWKHELLVDTGSDLHVTNWTTAPTVHSDSPFKFVNVIDSTLSNFHIEATLDGSSPVGAAIFQIDDCLGWVLRDSFHSLHTDVARPFVKATNSFGGGYSITSPIVESVRFYLSGFTFTGNFIEDTTQATQTIALAEPNHLHRYDGLDLVYATGAGATYVRRMLVPLLLPDGSAAAPALSFASDSNTGLFRGAADKLALAAGGVEQASVSTSATGLVATLGLATSLGNTAPAAFYGRVNFVPETVKTISYQATSSDSIIVMNGTGLTLTLPASPATFGSQLLHIRNNDAGTLTVARNGESINGVAANLTVAAATAIVLAFVPSSGWFVVG